VGLKKRATRFRRPATIPSASSNWLPKAKSSSSPSRSTAHDEVASAIRDAVADKPVVDVSNAVPQFTLVFDYAASAAEELQKKLPKAKVVKAFNTAFAHTMDTGKVNGEQISAFIAGDDEGAKSAVLGLARDIGYDAVDAGPLLNARYLEPMAMVNMQLGHQPFGLRPQVGFKLVHH
jgi:8-hydroxy-5-deazaflavin:NADPH oxidoreductase